jgi:integrase/recombinase XerD
MRRWTTWLGRITSMKRRAKKLPFIPRAEQLQKILEKTRTNRDRILLCCLFYLGLRVSEGCKLEVQDVDFERRFLTVREGKGCKDRVLPLPKALYGRLKGWIGGRTSGYVFESRKGGRLSTRRVQCLVRQLATAAGLPGVDQGRRFTPHKFRHAFASSRLERGADIKAVQELLGHASLATTEIYLHTTPERLRHCMEL